MILHLQNLQFRIVALKKIIEMVILLPNYWLKVQLDIILKRYKKYKQGK